MHTGRAATADRSTAVDLSERRVDRPGPTQLTGKRMNLSPPSDCVANKSDCDEITLINRLDGFDLDPRVAIGFAGAIDIGTVTDSSIFVQRSAGGAAIGLNRLVWDPDTNTLFGHPKEQLAAGTEYRVVVTGGVNGQAGTETFTTMSATVGLEQMQGQLGSDQAYTDAASSATASARPV